MTLEIFSAGYWLSELEAVPYNGDRAIVQDYVLDDLMDQTGFMFPVGMVSGRHFVLHAESSVPSDVLAVPEADFHGLDSAPVLVAKYDGDPLL